MNVGQIDGVQDVPVQTVLGEIDSGELGMTLAHEHLWASFTNYLWDPPEPWKREVAERSVTPDIEWILREDPFFHADNCTLDSVEDAVEELSLFKNCGGTSVIEVSNPGMGRDPEKLVEIATGSAVNVIMGSGWYIGSTHPESVKDSSVEALADELVKELTCGVGVTNVRPGVIGEIGISTEIAPTELRTLKAAGLAQRQVKVPIIIHLDGWARTGHQVLDVLEEQGVSPSAVVLGHMNPSGDDPDYQMSLAERGAWLAFDMTGMGFYYADHGGQSPSPDEDAAAVAGLMKAGYADQLLVSHDVFVKAMLTKNGGNGYAYVPRLFLPRLVRRFGVDPSDANDLLTENPKRLFTEAYGGR